MSHPLLTKVLADALNSPGVFEDPLDDDAGLAADVIAAMDPAIADRLEAALDVCQYAGYGYGYICNGPRDAHDDERYPSHPYVPLVQRIDQEGGR